MAGGRYVRAVRLQGCSGWLSASLSADGQAIEVNVSDGLRPALPDLRQRLRALFDLDTDPAAIAECLLRDVRLAPVVLRKPGLRVPGAFDGFELALRTVLGQQVTVKAATTLFGRFAAAFGEPLQMPHPLLSGSGPLPARVADASIDRIAGLGVPGKRAATIKALATAVADGSLHLDAGCDVQRARARLSELPGVGPWTAQYVAMRALRDSDAFPASDLGVLKALGMSRAKEAEAASQAWRPWRAYAVLHLWQLYNGG